jgi:hypothetical protein
VELVIRGLLTLFSLLVGSLWAALCGAVEVPMACQTPTPIPNARPVRDLSSALPVPDYFEAILGCNGLSLTGPRPSYLAPPSAWMESEKRLYASVLASHHVDVLVVPFQVQWYGFDRAERALLSADLAYAIGGSGQYSVADPFLVSRALGEGMRSFDPEAIEALASSLGAKKIVLAYVGHDGAHGLYLTIQVRDPLPASGSVARPAWQKDWKKIAFTDERTPFVVFHDMLPDITRSLPLGIPRESRDGKAASSAKVSTVNATPLESVMTDAARLPPAMLLSVFGALSAMDDDNLSRERLFEKALLASLRAPAAGDRGRFLEAYALLNLQRRPGALTRLSGLQTPAAATLRNVLNGDLPEARRSLGGVKDPFERLLLQVQVRDLEDQYGRKHQVELTAATEVFGKSYPAWEGLLAMRARQLDGWYAAEPLQVMQLVDESFPVRGMGVQALTSGMAVARGELPDDADMDVAIARQLRKAATTLDAPRCCASSRPMVTRWDLFWLIEGLAEARILSAIEIERSNRGLPKVALDQLNRLEAYFNGHPRLSAKKGLAYEDLYQDSRDDVRANWRELAHRDASLAAYWAQGQTQLGESALGMMGIPSEHTRFMTDAYSHDYPNKPYWPVWYFDVQMLNPVRATQFMVEALAFSTHELTPVWRLSAFLSPSEYRATINALGSRFKGNPRRAELWGSAEAADPGKPHDPVAQLRAAIAEDPEVWDNYAKLATAIIWTGGKYEEVSKAALAYPEFQVKEPEQPVAVANEATDIASLLYWQGQPDLAKPLFQIAADLDTGSEGSMRSAVRLDVLANHYESAVERMMRRAIRYPTSYSQGEYLSYLHAFGMSEEAWAGFAEVMADYDSPFVWESALVGHHRAGASEQTVRAWLRRPEIRAARFKAKQFAPYYAVLWNSTDRVPPADLGALVEELEGAPVAHIDTDGVSLLRPHRLDATGFEFAGPSPFRAAKSPHLPPGTAVKSELAYFADAYASLRRGDYQAAVNKFTAMTDRYPMEEGQATLSYFAYAAAKTGDTMGLAHYIQHLPVRDFDYLLAAAYSMGVHKDVQGAQHALSLAFRVKPLDDERPVMPDYQYAEACEWLYQETGDARFVTMLLDWVRVYQRLQPAYAWAYAMQYTYEKPGEARMRALAFTQYLDPASPRIANAPKADLKRAQAWFKDHNPFKLSEHDDEPRSANAAWTLR